MQHLSLKRVCGGGLGGSSFTGRYVKKVSGCWYLSPWGPFSTQGEPGMCVGAHIPGTLIGCVRSVGGGSFLGIRKDMGMKRLYLSLSEDEVFERHAKCSVNGPLSS